MSVADGDPWEDADEGLCEDFEDAVRYVGESLKTSPSEEEQRRLFGLHCRATRGLPPEAPLEGQEEQWAAWAEASNLSAPEAMREYVDLVGQVDPEYLLSGEDAADCRPPPTPGAQARAAENVFEAARSSAGLLALLPQHKDDVDADGLTPLIHAVDADMADNVNALLLSSADVNLVDPQGCGPLHYAAMLGFAGIAEQLLNAGADPRTQDVDGQTPADAAREEGYAELAASLEAAMAAALETGPAPDE